jgi:cell division septal protein FtsQ
MKDITTGIISWQELIQLKRKVRGYKKRVFAILYAIAAAFSMLGVYVYREAVKVTMSEVMLAYTFIFDKTLEQFDRINGVFNGSIHKIEISGLKRLTEQEVLATIYIQDDNRRQMQSSIAKIHNLIHAIPVIENVTIKRNMQQGTLWIKIKERDLVAIIKPQFSTEELLLDLNGEISQIGDFGNRISDLIIVEDAMQYDDFLLLYRYTKELNIHNKIIRATFISNRRWNLYFTSGLMVKLPTKNWQKAIDMLIDIDQKLGVLSDYNRITHIDFRVNGKIFIK